MIDRLVLYLHTYHNKHLLKMLDWNSLHIDNDININFNHLELFGNPDC